MQLSFVKMLSHIAVAVVIFAIVFVWENRKLFEIARKLRHGIKSYPILGVSYLFLGNCEEHMKAIQTIGRDTIKRGGLIAAWFGPRIYISVADPVFAEIILKTCLEKDDITRFTRYASGNGTIFAPVSIWRPRRKVIIPSFNIKKLTHFVQIFAKQSEILIEKLKHKCGTEPVALWDFLHSYSVDSVSETTLGVELHAQKSPHIFMSALTDGTRLIAARTCQPWLHSDLVYKLLPSARRLRTNVNIAKSFVDKIIKSKRKQLNENRNSSKPASENKPLLELLMQSSNGQGFSDLELREEMLTFLVAGTDTSAIGIGFVLLMLAMHPDVQEKVYEELKLVFGSSTKPVTSDDLPNLKYLDTVMKETLRLYPPGVVVLRKIHKDVTLPSLITIPSGCGAVINIWALHRNPSYWGPDADQFRPERFLDTPLKHPAQYIPFSYGPRNCVGYQYAALSMKTALATLLRCYQVLPSIGGVYAPPRLKFDFMLKDVDHFTVRLKSRV